MTERRAAERTGCTEARAATRAELALVDRPGYALAAAYEETYAAISGMLQGLAVDELMTVIPACPAWTVRDLVAHMTGVAADAIAARFPLVNPHGPWAERQPVIDAFTAEHVTSRRDMTIDGVRAEWAQHEGVLVQMLCGQQAFPAESIPIIDWMVVCDIAAHNQDLRGALGLPGDRDRAGVTLSLQRYVAGLSQRIAAAELPPLGLCTESSDYLVGEGAPSITVTASEWDLFRALGSRRSASQIRAYRWSGDADPYLTLFPAYGLPTNDLVE
jgi:uncharacterized protein (TIGR03083 family)